ncbi:hypothetical protein RJ639_044434 [Escallonia herrerae]|uniref:Uncharacterized protein n=1 Tax=Escallonia herrerae TaxID=1293975 RepID=A0AA88WB56_9ASTE|nr:hypothetical protein RJ639_044434 [Escallonia herrerae]
MLHDVFGGKPSPAKSGHLELIKVQAKQPGLMLHRETLPQLALESIRQHLVEALVVLEQFVLRWHAFFNYGSIKKILEPSTKQRHARFINQLHVGNLLDNSSPNSHPTNGNVCKTYCFTSKEALPLQSALQNLQILSSFFSSFVLLLSHLRECAHDCRHALKANRMSDVVVF